MFSWLKKLGIIILVLFIFAGNANTVFAQECPPGDPCGSGGGNNPPLGGGGSGGGPGGSEPGNNGGDNSNGGNSAGNAVGGGGSGGGPGGSEPGNNGGGSGSGGGNSGNGGGGNSGSRRATSATPAVPATQIEGCTPGDLFSATSGRSCTTPATPAQGQVLGAEKFTFTLFLKNNLRGNDVIELQKFLNAAGHDSGIIDGKFGPRTRAAVIKFQLANGLVGDGVVGPLTRAALNK